MIWLDDCNEDMEAVKLRVESCEVVRQDDGCIVGPDNYRSLEIIGWVSDCWENLMILLDILHYRSPCFITIWGICCIFSSHQTSKSKSWEKVEIRPIELKGS